MKKILPLIFMAVLMIFSMAQTTEALSMAYDTAEYPNGDYVEFWPASVFDGYAHAVITYASDGNAYATALTPDGWPDPYYYQMYLNKYGYLYCSTDGYYWFFCP